MSARGGSASGGKNIKINPKPYRCMTPNKPEKIEKCKIKLNGKTVVCTNDETIMTVAKRKGVMIPGFCGHPDFTPKGNCRVCVVEVKGARSLLTACSSLVRDGMEVFTETERVQKARNLNLDFIFAEHIEKCADCIWRFQCKLLSFAQKYKILITTFNDRKRKRRTYKFANSVEIDGTQCIDCRNCLDACSLLQKIDYLELDGKGYDQEVVPTKDTKKHCILCGQCAVHCPVSAAQEQASWQEVEKQINDEKKVVVAQFAPSIRVSIGEDFGMPYGKIATEQLVSGLRQLGFDFVFDVSFFADITTIIEAEELIKRITKKETMPMITSCCPGWVNYLEFYNPELIPNLTTARSPQIHGGGIIKTYWAEKMGIDPKNIVVVSIMPCTAKKYEASRSEMKINGSYPVDHVLTTREFSFMMKRRNIILPELKKGKADSPMGEYSGAGVIFGGSGGVMESALRTANVMICEAEKKKPGKICNSRLEFKEVRGLKGVKETMVDLGGVKLRVAVVSGIGNVEPVIKNLEKYDYIEVMACPGGCIGGGGQPIPTTEEIRKKRAEALYELDKSKKIRKSTDNKQVFEVLDWLKNKGHKTEHSVLHTKYKKVKKY